MAENKREFTHEGIVVSVNERNQMAYVRFEQSSACAACGARRLCVSSDSSMKEVECAMIEPLAVGDRVEVIITQIMGITALMLGYVFPLFLLIGALSVCLMHGMSEPRAAACAFAATAVYYLVLWLLRKRIDKQFNFVARKIY